MTAGDQVLVTVVSRAAELHAFPWAVLTLGESGRQLGARKSILLRYKWLRRVASGRCPPEAPTGPDLQGTAQAQMRQGPFLPRFNSQRDSALSARLLQ
jgi:hypothetical protein